MTDLRIGVSPERIAGNMMWRGVLRDGKRVVWRCACKLPHHYRDGVNGTKSRTDSAQSCASGELKRRQRERERE